MSETPEAAPPASEPALEPGIHADLGGAMAYGDYLCLDRLLAAQEPVSASHDELLFIVLHQATELWFKVMLHELDAARASLAADAPQPAFKMLSRVARIQSQLIQSQLIQSWDVLSTLTPADYLAFRDRLGQASGLQSHQYRLVEFAMGNKQVAILRLFAHAPQVPGRAVGCARPTEPL